MFQRLSRKGSSVEDSTLSTNLSAVVSVVLVQVQMGRFANRDALTTWSLSAITSISVSWIILFMTLLLCQPCLSRGIFVSIGHQLVPSGHSWYIGHRHKNSYRILDT